MVKTHVFLATQGHNSCLRGQGMAGRSSAGNNCLNIMHCNMHLR